MLAQGVVDQVRSLLAEGALSQREIARRLRISRGSVGAIARGTRPDYTNDFTYPSGPARRCPECGVKVQMPCLACQLEARRNA